VMNTIVAEPGSTAPDGCHLVEIMTGQHCSIGWYHDKGLFYGPSRYAMCSSLSNEIVALSDVSYISPKPRAAPGHYTIKADEFCDIGWTWGGKTFVPPVA
jgi:hypothetical protein